MKPKAFSKELVDILVKAIENKIYGSIEIYLEEGRVTQITQRIIKKVQHKPSPKNTKEPIITHSETSHPIS